MFLILKKWYFAFVMDKEIFFFIFRDIKSADKCKSNYFINYGLDEFFHF